MMAHANRQAAGPSVKRTRHAAARTPSEVVLPRLKTLFNRLDRDHDGKLAFGEFVAIARVIHKAGPAAHSPKAKKTPKIHRQKKPDHPKRPMANRGAKKHLKKKVQVKETKKVEETE
jgi:hypothetical protein